MFVKISAIVLIAFVASSEATWSADQSQNFYDLPKTLLEALKAGWTYVSGVEARVGILALGYQSDPRFVLLFGRGGEVAGCQIGVPVADVEGIGPTNYRSLAPLIVKRLNGVLYYTGTFYFDSDDSKGFRELTFDDQYAGSVEIPTKASLLTGEPPFLLKPCVPTMGTHYYTWNNASDCTTLYPWFLLTDGDDVIGVGFQIIGAASSAPSRTWFETIPSAGLATVVPDAAECITEAVEEFGVVSIHVWFNNSPQTLTCDA